MTKGFHDDMKIQTMPDLLAIINEEIGKKQKEALKMQKAQEADLSTAIQKEKELVEQISKARKIVEGMEADFAELEMTVEAEIKKKVEKGVLREADVKAGRINLKEFNRKGKYDKELLEETVKGVAEKLELAGSAIRSKNLEIMKTEEELYKCQYRIRGLILRPGISMLETLKTLREFTDEQVGLFLQELPESQTSLKEMQRKLFLCEGKSLGGGQNWERLTVKNAKRVAFDPMLPISLIPKLKSELSRFKDDDEIVTVYYYFKDKDVEVRPCMAARSKKNE